jgi:hypothetical protein
LRERTYHRRRVDCSQFQPEQVERMLAVMMRQREYLTRLVERMRVRRFPPDDPVYLATLGAMEKISNLCVVVAKCRRAEGDEDGNVMTRRPWGG